ncbi:hypothetical protein GCM10009718_34080 [Isoptericola halotolerans]
MYTVEDGRAECWRAEIAVHADSPASAFRTLRDAGLRKSQFDGSTRPTRVTPRAEFDDDLFGVRGIARRQSEDEGWEPWAAVPEGFCLNWRDSGAVGLHNPIGGGFRRAHPRD